MCGIFGVFSLDDSIDFNKFDQDAILNKLYSRGPDNQTFIKVDDHCALAHTRLSILDLANASNQPVTNTDKSIWVVFNGEIYNYKALKKLTPSYSYKTRGDTEVILALYEKFGEKFISKLRGMFSILIYDKRHNLILSIRDRFGIKPLYYYHNNSSIYYSSRIDVLVDLIGSSEFNKKTLFDYFNYGQLYESENTFFEGVHQQLPATLMSFSDAGLKKRTYWDSTSLSNTISYSNYSELLDYVDESLAESINHHMVSDVEVAVNLSSGLDSNYLRMYMASKAKENHLTKCFSFCFDRNEYNECLDFDALNQDKFNIFKTRITPSNILNALEDTIKATEGPVGGMGTIAFWLNMRDASNEGIKVILSGQGADELFAGYKYYINVSKKQSLAKEVMASDGTKLSSVGYLNMDYFFGVSESREVNHLYYDSTLKNARHTDLVIRKIPKLLMWQDKMSMAHSVETRGPFIDHVLFESLFHIPEKFLIKGKSTKIILRDVARRYAMAEQDFKYLETNKKYMPTPQREWFKSDFFDYTMNLIEESVLHDVGMIDKVKLKNQYQKYANNQGADNSYFIWKFINIETMFRLYI